MPLVPAKQLPKSRFAAAAGLCRSGSGPELFVLQFLGKFLVLAGPRGAAGAVASAGHRDSVEGRLGKGPGSLARVAGTRGFVGCCSSLF